MHLKHNSYTQRTEDLYKKQNQQPQKIYEVQRRSYYRSGCEKGLGRDPLPKAQNYLGPYQASVNIYNVKI